MWSGPLQELDTLPPGALLWNYNPQPDWLCAQAAGTDNVNCVHTWVTLNPGDFVTLVIDVLLPPGVVGPVENCVQDVWLPSRDPNDPAVILALEQALNSFGYPVGPIDGVLDVLTMNGIMQLQVDNGLPVTGIPDQVLIDALFGGSAGLPGDANPANDMSCHTVTVVAPPPPVAPAATPVPDLQTRKIQRTASCRPGGLCAFEIWFMNRGPGEWTGIPEIVDVLPQGATFVSATAPAICTQAGRRLTCRYPRQITLAPGVRGRVTITVRMPRNLQPGVRNCVSIPDALNRGDPDPTNNRQCIPVRVAPPVEPDIHIRKIQTDERCASGSTCKFDLWFINRGPGPWTGEPQLVDDLPSGSKLKSGSGQWKCQQSGDNLTCSHGKITIPPGRGVKVTVTIELPANLAPNARNCVRNEGDGDARHDPVPLNNASCITIRTAAQPQPEPGHEPHPEEPAAEPQAPPPAEPADTRVEKKQVGPCKPGHSCLFELKFVNKGPGTWSGKAKLSDLLPAIGAELGTWSPSSWKCAQNGTTVGCEHSGATVPPGEHLSLTMSIHLPEHLDPGAQNCVVLERPEIGRIDPNIIGDRACVKIDLDTPGFTPRPPAVVQPTQPCPEGTVRQNGQCETITRSCPAGYELRGDKCYSTTLTCPKGYVLKGKRCYSTQLTCPKGYVLRGKRCYSTRRTCPAGYVLRGKRCYPIIRRTCPPGFIMVGNLCIRIGGGIPHGHGHGHEH